MTILPPLGAEASTSRTTADWARTYAQAGVRVLPLNPNQKRPALKDWPNAATTDPQQLQAWFGNGTKYNLGLAMGAWQDPDTYLVAIDLDVHQADQNGVEAWQRLVAEHDGDQGAPLIANTATGGKHLVYKSRIPLTNEKGALPSGIDVRGQGGQIMVQPSTHPDNGKSPEWCGSAWQEGAPGFIPDWLLELIQTRPAPVVVPEYVTPWTGDNTRLGDEYNKTHTWQQVLGADGWTDLGNNNWARPGKAATRDQSPSAVLYPQHGVHGVLVVFSTNAPQQLLRQEFATTTGGHYKLSSPWAYEVAMRHGGDFANAARTVGAELRRDDERALAQLVGAVDEHAQLEPAKEFGLSLRLRTLSELIGQPDNPPKPVFLHFDGTDSGLFYPGAHNLLAAPSASGKSWVQAIVLVQQIRLGNRVVVIDYEMNIRDWFRRLQLLGATDTELGLVHYCQPDEALEMKAQYGARSITKAHTVLTDELLRVADLGNLTWVCIDGVTNAMTANSLSLLDNQDIAQFWHLLPEHIVRKIPGIGVGLNDHVPKNAKGDTLLPIGGQHKVATTSGSAFTMRVVNHPTLTPEPKDGVWNMTCIKDRHGGVGQQGTELAQVILSPNRHGHYTYQVLPYTGDANQRANGERDKVAQAIAKLQQAKTKATTNQIFAMTGIRKPSIAAHLVALQGLGLARNMGTQTNGNWQLIDQTPDIDLGLDF